MALSLLIACQSASNDSGKEEGEVKTSTSVQHPSFEKEEISTIYTDYIRLKDELVAGNFKTAGEAAKSLTHALNSYSGCENTAVISTKIAQARTIEEQRKEFTELSTDVIALFKHAVIKEGTIYVQHCPMANKGDGGDWLSSEAAIRNPYYGDAMLACGSVVEEIRTGKL